MKITLYCSLSLSLAPYVYFQGSNKKTTLTPRGILSTHLILKIMIVHLPVLCGRRWWKDFVEVRRCFERKILLEVLRRLEKIDNRQVFTHTHTFISIGLL